MRRASHRQVHTSALALVGLSALLALAARTTITAATPAPPPAGTAKEYFVEEEIDYIREAQGLSLRVTALLKLANIRLVVLGMKDKSRDDKELEKRISEIHDDLLGKPQPKPGEKPKSPPKEPPGPYLNLTDFTRIEMLRGYIEALDEVSSDIDDAYRDKREVRGPLEQFEKFCSTSIPLLRRFQSANAAELQAIGDARSATQEAMESAQDALKKIPKTEKSTRP